MNKQSARLETNKALLLDMDFPRFAEALPQVIASVMSNLNIRFGTKATHGTPLNNFSTAPRLQNCRKASRYVSYGCH
jgi:hypothetical protein